MVRAKRQYTEEHAAAGVNAELPEIETWPISTRIRNRYRDAGVHLRLPQDRSAGSRDFDPPLHSRQVVFELKSLKMYLLAYRNLGIFHENVVNRILADVVKGARPVSATVAGEFTPRGGISKITANWGRKRAER